MQSYSGCKLSLVTEQRNIVGVGFARKVFLPEGHTFCCETEVLGIRYADDCPAAVGGCVIVFPDQRTANTYSKMTALDVTDFAVVVKLPLLIVMDSRGTVK